MFCLSLGEIPDPGEICIFGVFNVFWGLSPTVGLGRLFFLLAFLSCFDLPGLGMFK